MSSTPNIQSKKEKRLEYFYALAKKSKIAYWVEKVLKWQVLKNEKSELEAWYQYVLLGCFDNLYTYPNDYFDENFKGKPIQKFAWRVGRQSFGPLTLIHTQDGKIMPISEHPDAFPTQKHAIILNLHLQHGVNLKCTKEHPIAVYRDNKIEWVNAEDIKIGEQIEILFEYDNWGSGIIPYNYIYSPSLLKNSRKKDFNGTLIMNNELAELLGLLTTDGSVKSFINKTRISSVVFTNTNINYINRVEYLVKNNFPDININSSIIKQNDLINEKERYVLAFTSKVGNRGFAKNSMFQFIYQMNFHPCGFPRTVAEHFTKEQVCAFLNGCWMGDGNTKVSLGKEAHMTEFACNNDYIYSEYFKELFTKLGIFCRIKKCTSKKSKKFHYKLRFTSHRVLRKLSNVLGKVLDKEFPEQFGIRDDIKDINIFETYSNGEKTTLAKLKKVTIEKNKENCFDMEVPDRGWFFASSTRCHNSGKCIPEGTIIHARDGKLVPIEEHPAAFPTRQNAIIYNIEIDGGYSVRATDNHPISVRRNGIVNWVRTDDIKVDDEIEVLDNWNRWSDGLVPFKYNVNITSEQKTTIKTSEKWSEVDKNNSIIKWEKKGIYRINNELAELLGYLTTNGNAAYSVLKNNTVNFTNSNINYLKRVEQLVNNNFFDICVNWYKKTNVQKIDESKLKKETYVLQFFHKNDKRIKNQNSLKKFLKAMNFHSSGFPRAVAEHFTKEQVCAFIKGAWAGNGNFYNGNHTVGGVFACGLYRTYAEYYHALFSKLGIRFKIESQFSPKSAIDFWKLRFTNATAANKFNEVIGDILDKPLIFNYRKKLVKRFDKELHEQVDGEIMSFSKVKKITIEKERVDCWDVEFPGKGWFISGNVRVHNSDCIAVGSLYLALRRPVKFTKNRRYKDHSLIGTVNENGTINETGWTDTKDLYLRGAKTIIASSDADKVRTNFDRVMKYIGQSPMLSAALENGTIEKKLHPYPELIFHVPGWTEPASITFRGPGAGGQTARSKTFDYKLYDECDYLGNDFFEAEKATSINSGDHGLVILSSTPTGKREHFYNACFVENTPVILFNGTTKNIQDIVVNDKVLNRYGIVEQVTKVMNRQYFGKIISFMTSLNDTVITSTSTHRFMSLKKVDNYCYGCGEYIWKENSYCSLHGEHTKDNGFKELQPSYNKINALSVGDYLAIPLKAIKDPKNVFLSNISGEFLYVPITQYDINDIEDENGLTVYNLTVGDDHSYCVNYYGVANCTKPDWHYQEFHIPSKENPNFTKEFNQEFMNEHPRAVYEHEIEAEWGTVEEGVFDWTYFEWVFRPYIEKPNSKDALSPIKTPIYRIFDTKYNTRRKPYPDEYECIKLTPGDIKRIGYSQLANWLRSKFPPPTLNKRYWFGADLGYVDDPSEFVVFEEWNGVMKLILRIHMEHIPYLTQADLIALLDTFYMFEALGMDSTGTGTMVEQVLKGKEDGHTKFKQHNFEKRLHGINFSHRVEVSGKFNGERIMVPVKQFMTDSIILAGQNRQLILPGVDIDDDIENQFRNHTYSQGAAGTIVYSKSDSYPEHCIDATRCAFFCKAMSKTTSNKNWGVGSTFRGKW